MLEGCVWRGNKTTSCAFLTKFKPFNKPDTLRNTANAKLLEADILSDSYLKEEEEIAHAQSPWVTINLESHELVQKYIGVCIYKCM